MTNAQKYFEDKMKNEKFANAISVQKEQVDLEWELETIKELILKESPKEQIIQSMDIFKTHIQQYQRKAI